jgi:hypothetical protein
LCLERGTVRTSISWLIRWDLRRPMNSSIGRVECPSVKAQPWGARSASISSAARLAESGFNRSSPAQQQQVNFFTGESVPAAPRHGASIQSIHLSR